jgi:hypothetical protein
LHRGGNGRASAALGFRVKTAGTRLQQVPACVIYLVYLFFPPVNFILACSPFERPLPTRVGLSSSGRRLDALLAAVFLRNDRSRPVKKITPFGGRVMSFDEARSLPLLQHMRSLDSRSTVVDGSCGYTSGCDTTTNIVGYAQFANTSSGAEINCVIGKVEEGPDKLHTTAVWLKAKRDIQVGEELFVSYERHQQLAVKVSRPRRPVNRQGNNALFWSPPVRNMGDGMDAPAFSTRSRKRKTVAN